MSSTVPRHLADMGPERAAKDRIIDVAAQAELVGERDIDCVVQFYANCVRRSVEVEDAVHLERLGRDLKKDLDAVDRARQTLVRAGLHGRDPVAMQRIRLLQSNLEALLRKLRAMYTALRDEQWTWFLILKNPAKPSTPKPGKPKPGKPEGKPKEPVVEVRKKGEGE